MGESWFCVVKKRDPAIAIGEIHQVPGKSTGVKLGTVALEAGEHPGIVGRMGSDTLDQSHRELVVEPGEGRDPAGDPADCEPRRAAVAADVTGVLCRRKRQCVMVEKAYRFGIQKVPGIS